jgi:hypothetical protein
MTTAHHASAILDTMTMTTPHRASATQALVPSLDKKNLPTHAKFFPFVWELVGTPAVSDDAPYWESAFGMRNLVVPINWQADRYDLAAALARAMAWCQEHHNIALQMCLGDRGIDLYRVDTEFDIEFE